MRNPLLKLAILSFTAHVVILAAAVLLQAKSPFKEFYKPAIIDVEIRSQAPALEPQAPEQAQPEPIKEIPKAKETPPNQIDKNKKKETYKPKPADKDALTKRIGRLEEKIKKKEAEEKTLGKIEAFEKKRAATAKNESISAPVAAPSASEELPNEYNDLLASRIRASWTYPGQAPKDLVVELEIVIRPDGEVTDISVKRRSGNTLYDNTVLKAIKKASPLPPPPKGFGGKIGFRFCPVRCE